MKKIFVGLVIGILAGFTIPTWAGRNSGGTFTFTAPGGPIVQAGQPIASAWANGSLTEIQTALTDSLSRSGQGGMTAGLKLIDGTSAAPGAFFSSSPTSGLYYTAGPTVNLGVGSGGVQAWTTAGSSIQGAFSTTSDVTFASAGSVAGTWTVGNSIKMKSAGTTTRYVTLSPPSGIASDYTATLPAAVPATTLPVTMTNAGVLNTAQIVNSQQNFGTPSATTDVAIKSYVDGTADTPTPGTNVTLSTLVVKKDPTGRITLAGKVLFGAATFSGDVAFLTLSSGFRPVTGGEVHRFTAPYYAGGNTGLGFMKINTDGTVVFETAFRIFNGTPTSMLPTSNLGYVYLNTTFYP